MKYQRTYYSLYILFTILLVVILAWAFISDAAVNDRIRVSNPNGLNARSCAGTSCAVVGQHAIGSLGTVIGGPTAANGYTWWQVNYDAGADGWSNGQWLVTTGDTTPPSPPEEFFVR